VTVDASSNVYVADILNYRIQKFDSTGNFLAKWGSQGSGDGQFNQTLGLATDAFGHVYASDAVNQLIQKFDSNGVFLSKWGSGGSGDGQFATPDGVAVDAFGDVYVADQNGNRLQKFDSNGNFITGWGSPGSGDGEFGKPYAVAVDALFNVYVGELLNDRIQKFSQVFDQSAGWVTGGGWINSPAGAYAADPSLTGKVNFGLVSKYQHGAPPPTGQTEFQFKLGNLNFHSTNYDWLAVAGPRAQYKGSGTINGNGDYAFILTAIDGQITGGGPDKFRIKIWNKTNGAVIYDSQMGAGDGDDPTTALGGGNIVIHT
jgi:hypothetical protein